MAYTPKHSKADTTRDDNRPNDAQHAQIESLLGAFALHALEPDEASSVTAHLHDCRQCHNEVERYRAVVALLDGPA
jgi:hypothetical protein